MEGKMREMSRLERQSVAVAEAVVAHHLGLTGPMVSEYVNFSYAGSNPGWVRVTLRTPRCHTIPQSQEFVVEVGHRHDEDYECPARLYQGTNIIRCFYWTPILPNVSVVEAGELF